MIDSKLRCLGIATVGAGFLVINADGAIAASKLCRDQIVVQGAERSDALSGVQQVTAKNGLIAVQLAQGQVVVQPEDPAWRIAGAAGVEIKLGKTCFIELPEQYFAAIQVEFAGSMPNGIGLGVCDPADGVCYWQLISLN